MDEALLRDRLDVLTPEPSQIALMRARGALDARIAASTPVLAARRTTSKPVRRVVAGGAGLAVAATTVALVITGIGPAPAASADVARTLRGAAASISTQDVSTAGYVQHLKRLVSSASGETRRGDEIELDSSILLQGTVTLRPTRGAGVWERISSPMQPIQAWGPMKAYLLEEAAGDASAPPTTERSNSSRFFWQEPNTVGPREIADVPRDPDALARDLTGVTNPDSALQHATERAVDRASALLGSGLADAGLQAAVYRALEQVPGLSIDRNAADIDGRPGVGIGVVTSEGQQRIDLIIEPSTGRYLGRTETDLVSSAGAPAGTIEEGTAVYPR